MTSTLAHDRPGEHRDPRALRHGDAIEVRGIRGRVWSAAGFCRSRHFDSVRTAELVDHEAARYPRRIACAYLSARGIDGSVTVIGDGEHVTVDGVRARCAFQGNQSPFVEFVPTGST